MSTRADFEPRCEAHRVLAIRPAALRTKGSAQEGTATEAQRTPQIHPASSWCPEKGGYVQRSSVEGLTGTTA